MTTRSNEQHRRESQTVRVGIDFGTTHTVVAVAEDGNYPILNLSFDYGDERLATDRVPSCLACYEGTMYFGPAARACHLEHYEDGAIVIKSLKRILANWHEGQTVSLGELTLSVEELLTSYFRALRQAIVESLDIVPETTIECVIAVPANAPSSQRFVTLRSFRAAGFKVLRILDEPCASAIQFINERYKHGRRVCADVIIYDLGGGTFDTTYLSIDRGTYDPILTHGISRLGGDDFDELLLQLAEANRTSPFLGRERVRMLDVAREAKESMSPRTRNLHLDIDDTVVTVPVSEYERAVSGLIEKTVALVDEVMHECNGQQKQPDRLVLVGGGSLLRFVPKVLAARFGRHKIHKSLYPLASVAIGAAIQAASTEVVVRDRLTNNFGVYRLDGADEEYVDVIFPKGQELPAPGETVVVERPPYDPRHNIGRFQYLECDAIDAVSGNPQGETTNWNEVLFPFDSRLEPAELSRDQIVPRQDLCHERIIEHYQLDEYGIVTARIMRTTQDDFANCYNLFRRSP